MLDFVPDSAGKFSAALQSLNQGVRERAYPGAVLAIGHGDQLAILSAGRFTYDADSPPVTADAIYDLASLTKPIATATAAMILVERGQLSLDRPAAFYLPDFVPPFDTADDPLWEDRSEVTVRHLLAHTSGLPAYYQFFLHARNKSQVLEAALGLPLEDPPGRKTLYSDVGFILLGEILERVSGQPLDAFCAREIFEPLEMRRTCFNPAEEWREGIAPTEIDENFRRHLIQGEVHDENAWVMGGVAGHAGLFAAAGDLAPFCRVMLAEGRVSQKQLVKAETIREFTRPSPAEVNSGQTGSPRALGWDKPSPPSSSGRYFSPASYGHLGYTGTSLWIDPEKSLFVILLTNRVHPSRANEAIRSIRPAVHDAVVEAL